MVYTMNPSAGVEGSRRIRVQCHPLLLSDLEVSLSYVRPCHKNQNTNSKELPREKPVLASGSLWHKAGLQEGDSCHVSADASTLSPDLKLNYVNFISIPFLCAARAAGLSPSQGARRTDAS